MITQALSLRAALSSLDSPGEDRGPQQFIRLTVTTTTPRHVREEPTGPPIRTEWVSEDRIYEFPLTALDSALTELHRIRDQVQATQLNGHG